MAALWATQFKMNAEKRKSMLHDVIGHIIVW